MSKISSMLLSLQLATISARLLILLVRLQSVARLVTPLKDVRN